MAGYSGTPLSKKLGIKEEHRVALVGAPAGFEALLAPLPAGVGVVRGAEGGPWDVILFFTTTRAELEAQFPALARRLNPAGGLWIAWPKKSAGVPTDLTENLLREVILPSGLVDNKVCAVDETWSGLRFVIRRENRPGSR